MSSSGNPRLQVATAANEGEKRGQRDVEQGDIHTEKQRFSPNLQGSSPSSDEIPEDEADEYIRLLSSSTRDEDRGGGEDQEMKRLWYMPWKKARKVPQSWLETDMSQGLSLAEIDVRRARFGYNELESPRVNPLIQFVGYFRGPILFVMELAVLLAAGLRDWVDFGVIIGILMLNAFVGWYQEKQAGDIVEKLKAGIAMTATVVREGKEQEIAAREVVPGDIAIVEDGQTIPADGKILADYNDMDRQKVQPIIAKAKKDQDIGDTVYFTTGAKRGKCYIIVTDVAKETFVGRTASLVIGASGPGHFQRVMSSIGTTLLVLVIIWLLAIWIGGFFRGVNIATPKDNNLLVYTLILLIIGVPVGLPCVTTTTMAVGAAFLARRKAIVQKLTAIESLAGVDVLCTDKTGTLTANQLSVHERSANSHLRYAMLTTDVVLAWAVEGVDLDWMLTVAVLASSHNVKALDPIDKVTVVTLKVQFPKAREFLKGGWVTHKFTPFDPVSKRITAEVEKDGMHYIAAKGAPNAILRLTDPHPYVQEMIKQKTQEFARRGFRTLGVACKENDHEWEFLGLLPIHGSDIAEAGDLGVRVKMLTALPRTNVYDSERLITTGDLSGSNIHDFVESADGFAEVTPENKYQVVEILQNRGHLTAMTGDGVNDAPSLKRADCGIAVQGASDAARSAADVVFLDEGLSTIITAIKVARQIFHRMKAYVVYRIALCLHLEIYLTLSMIILNETIRAELIVFIALFADLGTIAIAYDNAPFARAPVEWQLPKIWVVSTILGMLLAAATWTLRGTMFLDSGGIIQNFGSVQEVLFLEVALTENWLIFVTRGTGTWPSWQLVGAILGIDILASIFALYGWLSGPAPHNGHTDIVTVVKVWAYSFGVTVVVALFYFILSKISYLDNLGKKMRGKKNEKREDFLINLRRLTLVHEMMGGTEEVFRFQEGPSPTAQIAGR
ncbi:plasma-membrane proton-e [Russula vinacea]|nr:plasma-membrane proton-e [Russula vinacea]